MLVSENGIYAERDLLTLKPHCNISSSHKTHFLLQSCNNYIRWVTEWGVGKFYYGIIPAFAGT